MRTIIAISILLVLNVCTSIAQTKEKDYSHTFYKAISIGQDGCTIKSTTSVSHYGQFQNYILPIGKNIEFDVFECDYCRIDSSHSEDYNFIFLQKGNLKMVFTNECNYDFKITKDSIYTLSNAGKHNYKSFEELETLEIDGYGSNKVITDFLVSVWIPDSYQYVSMKENYEEKDFDYHPFYKKRNKENEIFIDGANIKGFIFEVKFKKRNPNLKTVSKTLDVEGDVIFKIYDDAREDGDIINVFIDNKIVLEHFEAKKKPVRIPISIKESSIVRIENVDEGKFPPNTVIVEILDKKKKHKLDIKTRKNQDYQVFLNKK